MFISITCTYCGKYYEKYLPNKEAMMRLECIVCGDNNLKIKDLEKSKIDYYEGAPRFKSEVKDEDSYEDERKFFNLAYFGDSE